MTGRRRATATSAFGVSKRENHDASGFYARFSAPTVVKDEVVNPPDPASLDRIVCGDARAMHDVADGSVALVVTSPPYFAGKEYETAMGSGHVPASYFEYLRMLEDVFAECARKLESGGRMAVNVANLGRKPYRSLAADVTTILQDRLGLLLRGEVVWQKGRGATGSCAWGSFQDPSNPVLRDVTERVVVAGKHRFNRAVSKAERQRRGLPSVVTLNKDEFMEATLDVWELAPESAGRVGHPAPFPVELPLRLIHLYTYEGDLVLDPFMGSGTTAVAAVQAGRHYVGYDTDPEYVAMAEARVAEARASPGARVGRAVRAGRGEGFQQQAVREGRAAREVAETLLKECGFTGIRRSVKLGAGVEVALTGDDAAGRTWWFDVSGAFSTTRPGLRRTDTVYKTLGRVSVMRERGVPAERLVLLSSDLPAKGSVAEQALRATEGTLFLAAFELLSPDAVRGLRALAGVAPRRRR